MEIEVITKDNTAVFNLTELGAKYSGVVNIGQKCKQVWNTIAIDSDQVDPFQCHLIGCKLTIVVLQVICSCMTAHADYDLMHVPGSAPGSTDYRLTLSRLGIV